MTQSAEVMLRELQDFDRACRLSRELESPACVLASEFGREEAREIFRRVAANEIQTGDFLRRFAEALTAADIENFAVLLPTAFKLLAKYPYLVEQYRAGPAITEFPPEA